MKSWKASIRTWEKSEFEQVKPKQQEETFHERHARLCKQQEEEMRLKSE